MSTATAILGGSTTERWTRQGLSLVLAIAFTGLIFGVLIAVRHQRPSPPPALTDDLHAVALPVQPPPPPTHLDDPVPVLDNAAIELAASPSPESPVKLPAALIPSDVVPPAHAIPRLDLTPGAVKPNVDVFERDIQHIYSRAEVDERTVAIFRENPDVTAAQLKAMKSMRATFYMVANVDGSVSNITLVDSTGNPEVDQACIAALREWRFKPAIKKGRKVRCWVQQNLIFKVSAASPFEYGAP